MNNQLIQLLNKEVANLGVLYTKLHNYHWFVKGRLFFQLHGLYENLYNETTEHFDEVAERILMLGGKPVATLKEFLELATIKEANGNETTEEMLQTVIEDFEILIAELTEGIRLAEEAFDDVTADLFVGMIASLQKHVWMLKTTLQ